MWSCLDETPEHEHLAIPILSERHAMRYVADVWSTKCVPRVLDADALEYAAPVLQAVMAWLQCVHCMIRAGRRIRELAAYEFIRE
jgi:hypothetical protein